MKKRVATQALEIEINSNLVNKEYESTLSDLKSNAIKAIVGALFLISGPAIILYLFSELIKENTISEPNNLNSTLNVCKEWFNETSLTLMGGILNSTWMGSCYSFKQPDGSTSVHSPQITHPDSIRSTPFSLSSQIAFEFPAYFIDCFTALYQGATTTSLQSRLLRIREFDWGSDYSSAKIKWRSDALNIGISSVDGNLTVTIENQRQNVARIHKTHLCARSFITTEPLYNIIKTLKTAIPLKELDNYALKVCPNSKSTEWLISIITEAGHRFNKNYKPEKDTLNPYSVSVKQGNTEEDAFNLVPSSKILSAAISPNC